jgi:nitrogen fixation protein FixH
LPVLFVLGLLGVIAYHRVTHPPPPEPRFFSAPFAAIPINGLTANLFTEGPDLRAADEAVMIEFRDRQGKPADVGDVTFSLSLTTPGMVVHSIGRVFKTATPGQYRTTVSPGTPGDWTVKIVITNAGGAIEATALVKVI